MTSKQKSHSIIDDVFSGQLIEAYRCFAGNHLSVNMQIFNILPVPIGTAFNFAGLVPLQTCFTKFCKSECLFRSEGLECDMCKKQLAGSGSLVKRSLPRTPVTRSRLRSTDSAFRSGILSSTVMSPIPGTTDASNDSGFSDKVFRTSTPVETGGRLFLPSRHEEETERRCLLRQLPDCLVIQLLRFSFDQYTRQSCKVSTPISIPLKGLDLSDIVYDNVTNREDLTAGNNEQKYDLYAVCSHLGADSTNYGHYVCHCLAENGIWYKFDDEEVTDVNMAHELTTRSLREDSYLLFYKRSKINKC